jgi:hypothetical protein
LRNGSRRLGAIARPPGDGAQYIVEYFELKIDAKFVTAVFSQAPIAPDLALALNSALDWSAIKNELFTGIGYPQPE